MSSVHTSADDWKAAAQFVGSASLAQSFADLDALVPLALRTLFRADLAVWERFDNSLRHLAYRLDPVPLIPDASLHAAFEQHFPEHPGYDRFRKQLPSGMIFQMSDFTSTRQFVQTGLWDEVYIHLRAKHQLGISGRVDEHSFYACGLNRLTNDYGPRERELAEFVQFHLTQLAQVIKRRESAVQAAHVLGGFFQHSDALFACIASDGTILEITAPARALLTQAAPGGMPDPSRVPDTCVELRSELRRLDQPRSSKVRRFGLVRVGTIAPHSSCIRSPAGAPPWCSCRKISTSENPPGRCD